MDRRLLDTSLMTRLRSTLVRSWPLAAVAAVALTALVLHSGALAQPGPFGRLAYVRALDNQWDVFSSDADGANEAQVTNIEDDVIGFEQDPRWSPDGEELAFHTYDGRKAVIWRIPFSGGAPTAVVEDLTDRYQAGFPAWKPPDGLCLSFAGSREAGAQGTDLKQWCEDEGVVTILSSDYWNESSSDWHPNGTLVAYEAEPADPDDKTDVYWDIRAVNADGTGDRDLVTGVGTSERHPRWSPDGTQLAYVMFTTSHGRGRGMLRIRDLASGTDTDLVGNVAGPPAWSPDGGQISFTAIADEGPAPAPGYGPVLPTPAPTGDRKGLYTVDLETKAVYRLAGAAGGAHSTPGSYEWGYGPDWTGGTATPTPAATDTSTPTLTPLPSDTPTITPTPTRDTLTAYVPFAVRRFPPPPTETPTPVSTATSELTPTPSEPGETPTPSEPGDTATPLSETPATTATDAPMPPQETPEP